MNIKHNVSNREDFKQYVRLSLCNCRNVQTSSFCINKGSGPTHCQFKKWNCQVFIDIENVNYFLQKEMII